MACFYLAIYIFLFIFQTVLGTPVSTLQGMTLVPMNIKAFKTALANGLLAVLNNSVYVSAGVGVFALIIIIIGGWALRKSIRKSKLPDEEQPNISPVIRKASLKKEKRLKKKTKKEKKEKREVEQKEKDEEMKEEKEVKVQKKDEQSGEAQIETKEKAVQTESTQEVKWKLLEFWINKDLEVQRQREEELREEEEFFS
ncbi:DNA ligase 1-like [Bombina bombina]|uniref:DNA ligase 1-like n=1 Tax=Bombina bombina TaxID=8345 RepID=UPI00235A964E|nr:DNA ligase 1-like [Bombina bombina]